GVGASRVRLAALPPELRRGPGRTEGRARLWRRASAGGRDGHELGPCLVWTGPQTTDSRGRTYGRLYDTAIGRTDYTHRVVWRPEYGPTAGPPTAAEQAAQYAR